MAYVPVLAPPSPPAAEQPMITRRQYIGLTLLTGLVLAVLGLPALLARPEGATVERVMLRFMQVLLFTGGLMALNYWLRFSPTVWQRWLRRLPTWQHRSVRIVLNLALAAVLGPTLGYWLGEDAENRSWQMMLVSSGLFALVILIVQLFIEVSDRSQRLVRENEQLKREQLQARYEGLKQQLSPHFLFNSLSTLRYLIHENPTDAEQFVEEMSVVYRYLLQYGEQDAVPLREEIGFLRSYVYLLQMRFGESLVLEIDLPERVQQRQVPPLALQTLVENAVKHNAVSRKQPLHIRIELGPDDCLRVSNSLRPRLTPEPSNGVGLRNLANRVRILHRAELTVEQSPEQFRVSVPLPG